MLGDAMGTGRAYLTTKFFIRRTIIVRAQIALQEGQEYGDDDGCFQSLAKENEEHCRPSSTWFGSQPQGNIERKPTWNGKNVRHFDNPARGGTQKGTLFPAVRYESLRVRGETLDCPSFINLIDKIGRIG